MKEFEKKTALVTGASKGIGKAIAVGLARMGADIIVNYFSDKNGALEAKKEIEALGRKAVIAGADVGKSKDVDMMFKNIFQEFDSINILINNSAIAIWKPFEKFSEEDWDRVMDTNLKSIFLCTRAALPSMKSAGGGSIINIGSMGGYAYLDCLVPYCASKGGVNLITRSLAVELAKHNIRVNCVSPGTVAVKRNFDLDPDFPKNWNSYIPLGKVGEEEDIVDAVIFLCSKNSKYITGQILHIDGGTTCYIPMPGAGFARE
jgi:NAD(P)-dependent dehydrogenase (short-subunit alcohol dehydrogenase family)